jgi:hypothetical protein
MATIQKYSNKIAELYTQTLKIRDFAEDNPKWKEIRMALNCASILIGCQQILTNEEYAIIKKFLIDEYKDFSSEEIIIAFHKVSSGAVIVASEHYGKLSAMYLGNVLKAYREFRHKKLAEKTKEQAKIEIKVEKSNDEKTEIRKQFLEQCFVKPFERLKETGQMLYDKQNSFTFFVMLWNRGKIKVDKAKSESYKKKAMKTLQAYTETTYGKRSNELKTLISQLSLIETEDGKSIQDKVREEACALYFQDYIVELSKFTTDIKAWLKQMGMYEIIEIEKQK